MSGAPTRNLVPGSDYPTGFPSLAHPMSCRIDLEWLLIAVYSQTARKSREVLDLSSNGPHKFPHFDSSGCVPRFPLVLSVSWSLREYSCR